MADTVRKAPWKFKRGVLILWGLVLAATIYAAYYGDNMSPIKPWDELGAEVRPPKGIDLRQIAYVAAPIVTFAFTLLAH